MKGSPVIIEGAKDVFLQHFRDMESGKGTPWAERSDTYMYLAQMRIAGWDVSYADLIVIAGYATSFAYVHSMVIDRTGDMQRGADVARLLGISHYVQQVSDDPYLLEEATIVIGRDYKRLRLLEP